MGCKNMDSVLPVIFVIQKCLYLRILQGQSRETGNIGYTRRRKTKQTQNPIVLNGTIRKKPTNNVNKTCSSYKQLEVNTNRTCGIRYGHHSTELRT